MNEWKSLREPPKTKIELRAMLKEAVHNTQQPKADGRSKRLHKLKPKRG